MRCDNNVEAVQAVFIKEVRFEVIMENNSTIDRTIRWGRSLLDYDGRSITILNTPCIRTPHPINPEEFEDELMFTSSVAIRLDEIIKIAHARAVEQGKLHMLVGYTESGEPEWFN